MIGRILSAIVAPKGMQKRGKGGKASEYTALLQQIAALVVGTGIELTQDEVEESLGTKAVYAADGKTLVKAAEKKAMPKYFATNLRKRVLETFGKGNVEVTEYNSGKGTRSIFQIIKLAATPAPAAPAPQNPV
jgi:hypothetical protein